MQLLRKISIQSTITQLDSLFAYPAILLFEGNKNIIIVNLSEQDTSKYEQNYTFEDEIIHYVLVENFLWLVLKSRELFVINILKNSILKINVSNYANYKIKEFETDGNQIILISDSGERLLSPFTKVQLSEEFDKSINEITVSLEKTLFCGKLQATQRVSPNGLNIETVQSKLLLKCAITGVTEKISLKENIDYFVPWGDCAVIANRRQMWRIDLQQFNKLHDFGVTDSNYLPLGCNNNIFYYLLWDNEINLMSTSLEVENIGEPSASFLTPSQISQETLKSQLKLIVQDVLKDSGTVESQSSLQNLFNEIDDPIFLMNLAVKLCRHNVAYKSILCSIQKRVFSTNNTTIIDVFIDTMIKLDLLEYIYFRGLTHYENNDLIDRNVIELCQLFISKSDLDLASICWLKYGKMNIKYNSDDILKILDAVPSNVKLGELIIWLHNLIPSLLEENPFNIDLIAKWTSGRIFSLEQSSFWPKIGLKYIEAIINVLESSLKTITIRPISMDELDLLKDHIKYIIELKDKYKINMLISEITAMVPTELALIMLRRCYTEDLELFLKNNLTLYAYRYQFDLDETLRSFIETQMASSGGTVDAMRLEILLQAFHYPTNRLDCLLHVVKYLDVPWDPCVETIAINAAALIYTDFTISDTDRLLAQEINKELNYAKIKVILKKYNFPITLNEYTLVIQKFINSPVTSLEDLKTVINVMPSHSSYANLSYIDKCLRECETKAALEYYETLSNRNKRILIKSIENKYEHIICGARDNTLERNYLDFLKGSHYQQEAQLKAVEKLYYLKNTYAVCATLNNINNEEYQINIPEKIKSNCITDEYQLTQCLEYQVESNMRLIYMLKHISTNYKVQNVIKQLISQKLQNKNNVGVLIDQMKHEEDSSLVIMSHSVLSDFILNCPEENLHMLTEILSMINAIKNTNIIMKNLSLTWKFNYVFLPISSASSLYDLIKFYDTYDVNKSPTNDPIIHYNGSDFTSLRMIAYSGTHDIINKRSIEESVYKKREKIAKKLLNKVISSQDVDQVMLTCLLLLLRKPDIVQDNTYLVEILHGQSENLSPAILYYLSCPAIRATFELENVISTNTLTYSPLHILKSKFNINISDISLPDGAEQTWDVKVVLFYILKQHPSTSFERLLELCRTLHVCINDGLSLLLISLLTNWDLKYKIIKNKLGCKDILIENDEKELLAKCLTIWQSIGSKDFLKDILHDFWKNGEVVIHGCIISINPYFYEVLFCIYKLLTLSFSENRYSKDFLILNYLKDYQRKSAPKQYEFEHFSIKGLFPEIGHYRLPFHLFLREDMWANLKSEITLETYERWLTVVSILSLDSNIQTARDMICSNAVKQTMTSRKQSSPTKVDNKDHENDTWKMISREEPLLRAAHKCVRHIANMEWAGACLFYVLQGCARGADQVAVAQLCYQFSQKWAVIQPDNRAVRQMERMYSSLSTRHSLHKIEWACEELIRLTSEPTQLIQALYVHPQFIHKFGRHDINRTANEIADKNGININCIRIQILENILDKNIKDKNSPSLNTVELLTAKYILKATCSKMGAIYLSRIAFDDDNDYNKTKKLRALQCFMSVVDQDTAAKVTNTNLEKLWPMLLELLYSVKLETIDMPWVISNFKQDKIMVLHQLIHASGTSIEALKVSAELAHRFGNQKIVRDYIPILMRASMYDEIIPLLLKVTYPLDNVICSAWRAILLQPFQIADYPITDKQKSKCLKALNLLPLCPFIKDEDLIEIWKNCIRCKCLPLGCLVLPYMTSETRETLKELTKIDKRSLIIGLKNLHSESYLVSSAMCVIDNISRKNCR